MIDASEFLGMGDTVWLRTETVLEILASGRAMYGYTLGCCICRHAEGDHEAGAVVARNGCRCCATSKVIPVRVVEVRRKIEEVMVWPE